MPMRCLESMVYQSRRKFSTSSSLTVFGNLRKKWHPVRDAIFVSAAVLALLVAVFLGVLTLVVLLGILIAILVIHSSFLRNFYSAVTRPVSLPHILGFILCFEDEA